MIPCKMFLRAYLRNSRIIALLGSVKDIVDGLGDAH